MFFFRSVDVSQSIEVFQKLFWFPDFSFAAILNNRFTLIAYSISIALIIMLVLFEKYSGELVIATNHSLTKEVSLSVVMIMMLLSMGVYNSLSFIYFQF